MQRGLPRLVERQLVHITLVLGNIAREVLTSDGGLGVKLQAQEVQVQGEKECG